MRRSNFRGGRQRGPSYARSSTRGRFINTTSLVDMRYVSGAAEDCCNPPSATNDTEAEVSPNESTNVIGHFRSKFEDFVPRKQYFCKNCRVEFDYSEAYGRHMMTHKRCTERGCLFEANQFHLTRHMRTHFVQDRPFFCEKCFLGYYEQRQYQAHLNSHIKCSEEGCSFEADSWHLAKHMMNVHHVIRGQPTEANEKRWINERKRKFPTNAVVTSKNEEEKEKISRGEILTSGNQFGKFRIGVNSHFKRPTGGVEDCHPSTSKEYSKNGESSEVTREDFSTRKMDHFKGRFRGKKNESRKNVSLLEMLLQDDIVRERNILLQCIRYIVYNDFFDKKK